MGADGTGARNVTRDPASDSGPYWAPDGRRLLFVSDRGSGSQDLYILDLATSEVVRLTAGSRAVEN